MLRDAAWDGLPARFAELFGHFPDQKARAAFAIIKPDAVVAGRAPALLTQLEHAGFDVLDLRVMYGAGARCFEELYKFNIAGGMLGARPSSNWWLNSQPYLLGPSVAVFGWLPNPSVDPAAFGAIKGPSNPAMTMPGQLRHDFHASNRAMNLVHISDDPLGALREYLIFNSEDRLRAALSGAIRPPADWLANLGFAERRVDIDPVRTVGWAYHALRDLAEIAPSAVRLPAGDGELRRRFNEWSLGCCGDSLGANELYSPLLADLVSPACWTVPLADRLIATLSGGGIRISAWDAIVLRTTFFYAADIT